MGAGSTETDFRAFDRDYGNRFEHCGRDSVISSIILSADTDLGELKERLERFSAMGFDHAVVLRTLGAPSEEQVRKLMP